MLHLIDANNLAGKLDLRGEENFDRLLIDLIKKYNQEKHRQICLVFDSTDPMGDKFTEDAVTIIYTPKDNYYKNADDKIIEIVLKNKKKSIRVITDDIEIKNKIEKLNLDENLKIELEQAGDFAEKIKRQTEDKNKINSQDIISDDEKEKLNDELLKIWSK